MQQMSLFKNIMFVAGLTAGLNLLLSLSQQTLPVDLSSSALRSSGSSSTGFHGTSAFDPCCPGSASRPPAYVSQAASGPSQQTVADSFSSAIVAQPQPQPPQLSSCRHYIHPPCTHFYRNILIMLIQN